MAHPLRRRPELLPACRSGWGDAANERPTFPPYEDCLVDFSDGGADWGIVHPRALIGRTLAFSQTRAETRATRDRLVRVVAALTRICTAQQSGPPLE